MRTVKRCNCSDYVKPGQYNMVEFWASLVWSVSGEILTCATCTMLMERGKMPLT